MSTDRRHLLVLAPTPFTWKRLEEIPNADRYVFHAALDYEDLLSNHPRSFDSLLDEARKEVQSLEQIDGIIAFWDFPATCLAACLNREFGLPGASLESVVQCEHKHWSRMQQQAIIPDLVPKVERVDPYREDCSTLPLSPPFWLKPIKSASSMLGFRIESLEGFKRAIAETRERIHIYGDSFNEALGHAELPDDLRRWGGSYCIAESLIGGEQVTLEGYVHAGAVHFHGAVDSIRYSNGSTFSRYEYPSHLDKSVLRRMEDATARVLKHIGYDNATFNVEWFYDTDEDQIWLVELNPRISQSHAKLFQLVEGAPNFSEMVSTAIGAKPAARPGGEYACAAKLFYRTTLQDATVTAVPSKAEIARIEGQIPGVEILLEVKVGQELSDLPCQDSYSYGLAQLHIGGRDEGEILQKYQECVDRLTFGFQNMRDVDVEDGHHRVSAVPQLLRQDSSIRIRL